MRTDGIASCEPESDGASHARARVAAKKGGRVKRASALVSIAFVATAAVSSSFLISASASGGGDGCDPGRPGDKTTRWDGGYLYQTGTGGVLANIKVYSPWVASWSSAWVMLTNKPSTYEHHVQVGWDEYPGNARHYFYEYTSGGYGQGFRVDYTAPANWINTTHSFEVLYNNYAPGVFSMYMDGTLLGHTPSDFTPNEDQIYGETHSEADQMAGGISNKEVLSNEHVWTPVYGWEIANLTPFASNHTWYDTIVVSTTEQEINDTACND